MLRKGEQFLLHMFISISLEFYLKLYSNTAYHKLWTSIDGTLQTQLVPVVFICAYRFVFNYWYTFPPPHVQLSTTNPGAIF